MSEDYKIKINGSFINGCFYNLSEVSKKPIEKDETITKNKAFSLIFDALDKNKKDSKLDSKELATFFSDLMKADTDNNRDITPKELEAITKELNKQASSGTEIKVADVEGFFSHVMAEMSDLDAKDKIKVEDALKAEDTDTDTDTDTDSDDSSGTHTYTVQMDEDYTDIIKRSLKAKGVEEPTEEQIQKEKENFEKNNPGAVKRNKKGVEYLLVGAQVKLEGKLENKDNSQEQIDLWVDKYINKKDVSDRVKGSEDHQGEDGNTPDPAIVKKAEDAGYRKTYSPDFFYDEKTKKHMKYNSETGKFEEVPNLTYVDKNTQIYTIPLDKGRKRKEVKDNDGNITKLSVQNYKNHTYTNPAFVANVLGLRETNAKGLGVYYNEATKQHFVWDPKTLTFVARNDIVNISVTGGYTDTKGEWHNSL